MSSRLNLNPPAPGALVNLATTATPAARRCTTISASARSAALSIPEVFNMAYLRTPTGLLIHHAAFADAPVRPESQEIATIGGGRAITRGYAQALMRLMPQVFVLLLLGGGVFLFFCVVF